MSKLIDVWEISPHYDSQYDYLLTDEGDKVDTYVQMVAEYWLDAGPDVGDELVIRVKVLEMTEHDYEEATEAGE